MATPTEWLRHAYEAFGAWGAWTAALTAAIVGLFLKKPIEDALTRRQAQKAQLKEVYAVLARVDSLTLLSQDWLHRAMKEDQPAPQLVVEYFYAYIRPDSYTDVHKRVQASPVAHRPDVEAFLRVLSQLAAMPNADATLSERLRAVSDFQVYFLKQKAKSAFNMKRLEHETARRSLSDRMDLVSSAKVDLTSLRDQMRERMKDN